MDDSLTAPASDGDTTGNPTDPRTRRTVLLGAVGGVAAWAAASLGRPRVAHAEGEGIAVGGEYDTATSVTRIANHGVT